MPADGRPPRTRSRRSRSWRPGRPRGKTSAHAESTSCESSASGRTREDLRARGVDPGREARVSRHSGRPPRTRSRPGLRGVRCRRPGKTSAHAESTVVAAGPRPRRSEDLRARGVDCEDDTPGLPKTGRPPRTRSRFSKLARDFLGVRKTSAHAESVSVRRGIRTGGREDLRARGVGALFKNKLTKADGRPPRTRSRCGTADSFRVVLGKTSAHAESVAPGSWRSGARSEDLRARGVGSERRRTYVRFDGRPPRTRSRCDRDRALRVPRRKTSAHAESVCP